MSTVLRYLESLAPVVHLSLLDLSCKLVTLLSLLSAQRGQTIHGIDVRNIEFRDNIVIIRVSELLKTSSARRHFGELKLAGYASDINMCIVHILQVYLLSYIASS